MADTAETRLGKYVFEAKIGSRWCGVTWHIFRSWTGGRRVNGRAFTGPVFYLGTSDVAVRRLPTETD